MCLDRIHIESFWLEIWIVLMTGEGAKFIFLKHGNKVNTSGVTSNFWSPAGSKNWAPSLYLALPIWLENVPLPGPFLPGPSRSCGPCRSIVTPLVNTIQKTDFNSCLSESACATRTAAGRWAALVYRNLYDHHFLMTL